VLGQLQQTVKKDRIQMEGKKERKKEKKITAILFPGL
jgi:hypothetical protein